MVVLYLIKYSSSFELVKALRKEGYTDDQIHSRLNSYLNIKASTLGVPYRGTIELTPFCNFQCKMCYVQINPIDLNKEMLGADQWKLLITQAYKAGMREATLTGGECLTVPFFDDIYLFLYKLGVAVSVFTNGYYLDETKLKLFNDYPPKLIQISLYGSNEEVYENVTGHRAFTKVMSNILKAKNCGLLIRVAVTPSRYNIDNVIDILDLLDSNGLNFAINSVLALPRIETGRNVKESEVTVEDYIRVYKHEAKLKGHVIEPNPEECVHFYNKDHSTSSEKGLPCTGGSGSFHIRWDGTLHPCVQLQRIESYPLIEGFDSSWEKIKDYCSNYPRIPQCKNCLLKDSCRYCVGVLEGYSGAGKQCEDWCKRIQKFIRAGLIVDRRSNIK